MFLFETFSRMYYDMEKRKWQNNDNQNEKIAKRKMFQMSTMILGVIRNNEELVSHNI